MRLPLPEWLRRRLPPLPHRDQLLQMRWLRPFAKHLSEPAIWHWNRRSVARGMALGMFITIAVPLPIQIMLSALLAVFVRANVPVAAVCAFVSNPFTTPAILVAAYETGNFVLSVDPGGVIDTARTVGTGAAQLPVWLADAPGWIIQLWRWFAQGVGWLDGALQWVAQASLPVAVGLLVLAVVAAAIGYVAVQLLWRVRIGRKWTKRSRRRIGLAGAAAE